MNGTVLAGRSMNGTVLAGRSYRPGHSDRPEPAPLFAWSKPSIGNGIKSAKSFAFRSTNRSPLIPASSLREAPMRLPNSVKLISTAVTLPDRTEPL